MKYRKKPVVIEATQWFKNGDHPEDNCMKLLAIGEAHPESILSEGKVVRRYREPEVDGQKKCKYCKI